MSVCLFVTVFYYLCVCDCALIQHVKAQVLVCYRFSPFTVLIQDDVCMSVCFFVTLY